MSYKTETDKEIIEGIETLRELCRCFGQAAFSHEWECTINRDKLLCIAGKIKGAIEEWER